MERWICREIHVLARHVAGMIEPDRPAGFHWKYRIAVSGDSPELCRMQPFAFRGTTPIYVFEKHSDAVVPWAELRRNSGQPARLITFDRHNDTMVPFLSWAYQRAGAGELKDRTFLNSIPSRVASMDFSREESILEAAGDLRHDEHIQAAQHAGIIGDAFVVALDGAPTNNERVSSSLHYLNGSCFHGCQKRPHDDDCLTLFSDLALEDSHLVPLFEAHPVAAAVLEADTPLILDIDLDYFRTERSLLPQSHSFFLSLAGKAGIITVATEPVCVEEGRFDESITAENSLSRLLSILDAV